MIAWTKPEVERMTGLTIRVGYPDPPIPWCAWVDGQEEWGSGHGATETEALRDLWNRLVESDRLGPPQHAQGCYPT